MRPDDPSTTEPPRRTGDSRLAFLTAWVISAAYMGWLVRLGWIPHDDGALAQAADWVNHGLLPHRDFIELYTGGLSMLHALAFRVFGTTLGALRLVLFIAFVAWVPAVFFIARRLASPIVAAGVTLLAVVWSVPIYPASMPSWYNLFLATFGVAALFKYIDDRRARWLFVAGLAGGLSFLVKVIGLYYVAGALLFIVFETQASDTAENGGTRPAVYAGFVTVCLAAFVVALVMVVRRALHPAEVMQFVVPGTCVAAMIAYGEWKTPAANGTRPFARLIRRLLPFIAGVALPVVLFLIPYVLTSSLDAFVNGVFTLPMRRMTFASLPAVAVTTLWVLLPVVLWAFAWPRIPERHRRVTLPGLGLVFGALLVFSGTNAPTYRAVWDAVRDLLPILVIIGVTVLARRRRADDESPALRERTMALLAVTSVCTLVQFPYASSVYFMYIAPLIALTALALFAYAPAQHRRPAALLTAFLVLFAVLRADLVDLRWIGIYYKPAVAVRPLQSDRGGVSVDVGQADVYEPLIAHLRAVSKTGATWAYPDTPEVYFLSGLASTVGRSPFEFFDDRQRDEKHILAAIDSSGISAVVVNTSPGFSTPVTESLFKELAHRFPAGQKYGPFILLWRP
jgi:hypothetical protein